MEANLLDRPGGIFVRPAQQISHEDRVLMQTVARVIISDAQGSLADQVGRRSIGPPEMPLLVPTAVATESVTISTLPAGTEDAHDPLLNPIRAKVSLSLQVLSYNDLTPDDPGHALFLAHQVAKEAMARSGITNSLDQVVGGSVRLI